MWRQRTTGEEIRTVIFRQWFWFLILAPHWDHLGSFQKYGSLGTIPKESDLANLGWGLGIRILKKSFLGNSMCSWGWRPLGKRSLVKQRINHAVQQGLITVLSSGDKAKPVARCLSAVTEWLCQSSVPCPFSRNRMDLQWLSSLVIAHNGLLWIRGCEGLLRSTPAISLLPWTPTSAEHLLGA